MAEYEYQRIEAWNTAVRLATSIGRLKVGSNLKAAADAHQRAFEEAGEAAAIIADGSLREGPGQAGAWRDARAAFVRVRSWLHVLAAVMNEQDSVFGNELDLAETGSKQLSAMLRTMDRGQGPARPPMRGGTGPGPRPGGPPPRAPRS